jgi:hypothetical protein
VRRSAGNWAATGGDRRADRIAAAERSQHRISDRTVKLKGRIDGVDWDGKIR